MQAARRRGRDGAILTIAPWRLPAHAAPQAERPAPQREVVTLDLWNGMDADARSTRRRTLYACCPSSDQA